MSKALAVAGRQRFLAMFRDALVWLQAAADVKGTRFEAYEAVLARWIREGGISRATWTEDDVYTFHDAFMTAVDLIRAHEQFGGAPPATDLEARLRKYIRGAAVVERDETPGLDGSTEPRDVGFEISIGAWLKGVGIPAYFPPDKEGDVAAPFEGCDLNVEAKRPQREKRLQRAVNRAAAQLARHGAGRDRLTVNLLALSIGKIVRRGELILPAPSIAAAKEELNLTLKEFKDRNEKLWQPSGLGSIHGVLIQLESPVHITTTDEFYAATMHVMNAVQDFERSAEVMVLGRVVERLSGTRDRRF